MPGIQDGLFQVHERRLAAQPAVIGRAQVDRGPVVERLVCESRRHIKGIGRGIPVVEGGVIEQMEARGGRRRIDAGGARAGCRGHRIDLVKLDLAVLDVPTGVLG